MDDTECVRISQDSPDTFPRGVYCMWNPGMILSVSEYPRIPRILFQGGYSYCMWNPGMILSVSEYPRILFQGGILYVESWDDTECVRVSQDSPDTFPRGV